ncbi:MAG: 50S ribosomal protein L20 [Candidatus Uhrbacteria bacterium GW2011_GWA2_41_10]|nr:MAG: 50S ribosomal protein L20 [Candidatus Uhrbacteria bacterium GW2011_GWA2_41_10]
MPRVKRGTHHVKRRTNLLKKTKGYMWGRKSKMKLAHTAVLKAGTHAYRDRRNKKRSFRRLWQLQASGSFQNYCNISSKIKYNASSNGGFIFDKTKGNT